MPIPAHFLNCARAASLALVLCSLGSAADAHPHVWISTRNEILFDQDHNLSAIRQTWTFDEAYSAYSVLGLDSRRDRQPDPDKLNELAQTNLDSMTEWNWYTRLKVNGTKVDFAPPVEAIQTYSDGRLTLSFLLPLKTPIPVKTMFLKTDDPSFLAAFNLADDVYPIRLINAPTGCVVNVNRPFKAAAVGVEIIPDTDEKRLTIGKDGTSVGAEFIPRVMIACP